MNNKGNLVCIVIPVYKSFHELNEFERHSIRNCFEVLGSYLIKFIGGESLDWLSYKAFCLKNEFSFSSISLKNEFFSSIDGYNTLLLNTNFYTLFAEFKYILIHQTDCFVFRDELTEWCSLNYDYIGAPWLFDVSQWMKKTDLYPFEIRMFHYIFTGSMKKVGNGGLSLRKVSSSIYNLKLFRMWASKWKANEDSFFSHCAGAFNPFFRIPAEEVAVQFSFDALPGKAFELNKKQLPFGCHAWYRSDMPVYTENFNFWKTYISSPIKSTTD